MILAALYCLTVAIAGGYIADLQQDGARKDDTLRLLTAQIRDDIDALKILDSTALAGAMALSDCTGRLRKATGKETL
jgi:hypothetical protein